MPTPDVFAQVANRVEKGIQYFVGVSVALPLVVLAALRLTEQLSGSPAATWIRLALMGLLYVVPLHWAALITFAWFHEDRGLLAGSWARWPAAVFLTVFTLAAIFGPIAVLAL